MKALALIILTATFGLMDAAARWKWRCRLQEHKHRTWVMHAAVG